MTHADPGPPDGTDDDAIAGRVVVTLGRTQTVGTMQVRARRCDEDARARWAHSARMDGRMGRGLGLARWVRGVGYGGDARAMGEGVWVYAVSSMRGVCAYMRVCMVRYW